MFITLEGIDGSGKSTQSKFLEEYLQKINRCYQIQEEPRGVIIDKKLFSTMQDNQFIFWADRFENLKTFPPDQCLTIFIRYSLSTLAYCDEKDFELHKYIYNHFRKPDLIIYLDVSPENALKRIETRGTDTETLRRLNKLKKGYERALKVAPENEKIIIDTNNKTQEEVFKKIKITIEPFL